MGGLGMRWIKRLFVLLVIVAIIGGGGAWWGYSKLIEPYRGYADAEVFVDIPPGSGPGTIGERLVSAGVVRDALTFRGAVLVSGRARSLKALSSELDDPRYGRQRTTIVAREDPVIANPLGRTEGFLCHPASRRGRGEAPCRDRRVFVCK